MNPLLLRSCVAIWLIGILGMWFVRAVLVLTPTCPAFQVAAGFWIVGGLGYTGLGLFTLVSAARGRPQ